MGTKITDAGLKKLAKLKQLERLGLSDTLVTDTGLKELVTLKQLIGLNLIDPKVTKSDVAELRKALPQCKIFSNAKK